MESPEKKEKNQTHLLKKNAKLEEKKLENFFFLLSLPVLLIALALVHLYTLTSIFSMRDSILLPTVQ